MRGRVLDDSLCVCVCVCGLVMSGVCVWFDPVRVWFDHGFLNSLHFLIHVF